MNARFLTWTTIGLLTLAGCVPSLNSVYFEENLIFDSSVLGVWRQPKSKETWDLTQRDNKSYNLVYTNEEGQQGKFIARLAVIQGSRFLDLYPDEAQSNATGVYKFHLVPIHTIYLVKRTTPKLELAVLDYPWLDDYLADHPNEIQHATFNGRKLITAPTDQVQTFVLAHLDAFRAPIELQRAPERDD